MEGKVKWFRDDGTGYIAEKGRPNRTVLVHYSSIQSKKERKDLKKGQRVKYDVVTIMGREVAINVKPL